MGKAHTQDEEHHDSHAHELPFWKKYIFSTDHKVIGIQYGLTALIFLFFGFCLMMMMRWQIAYSEQPITGPILKIFPFLANLYPHLPQGLRTILENAMPNGVMVPDFYNQLGAMHGTIMIFLGVVPLSVGAFGNYVVPLQLGAPDMAFPRLNMMSYWLYFIGGVIMLISFFIPGGAANSGWTSYAPLSVIATEGQTWWLIGMAFLIQSSLLGSINTIATIFQLRAKGLSFMRLPFFVWAQLVTGFLLLLAFPPLFAAAVLQLMDRLAHTSFFMPSGLLVSGQQLDIAGGGSVLLWQHLFWFLAHPEVYVLILPAMGIVTEIIVNNTRKSLWGYKTMIYSIMFLGFTSFIVWAHHMYLTGMGTAISSFFQLTTMIISVPSVIVLTSLFMTLWGGSIRFNTPMLFALAFLPMFGIGGLTGLPLGLSSSDIYLHDTYYVIGHFHYVVAPGTIFGLFAGIYYWFPKATGRKMNEFLGQLHFWPSLIFMNMIFMPMFIQGLAGMARRMYDGGLQYNLDPIALKMNLHISQGAWLLGLAQIPFIINFIWSMFYGKKTSTNNPWESTTIEWTDTTSPPLGHGNFEKEPVVYRGPYEYSLPEATKDFTPQTQEKVI